MGLLEFQQNSAAHIMNHFEDKNVYLLADETGLGKTHIAGEVMLELSKKKHDGFFNVVYIASNLVLAKKNANEKLQKFDADNIEVMGSDRLSMLWEEVEKKAQEKGSQKNIRIFPITPEVSLTMKTEGTADERGKCVNKYNKLIEEEIDNDPQYSPVKEVIEKIRSLSIKINKISDKITKLPEPKVFNEGYLFRNLYEENKSGHPRSESLNEYRTYKDIEFDINSSIEQQTLDILKDLFINFIVRESVYFENIAIPDDYAWMCDLLGKALIGNDFKGWLKKQKDDYSFGSISLNDILNQLSGIPLVYSEDIFRNDKDKRCFYKLMEHILSQQKNRYVRTVMSFYSLVQIKPDLVIIDEIQNYPEIFSENSPADERAGAVKLVIDTLLGRSSGNNGKVLMLSATPYAYKNAITIENDNDETDELDVFIKHLVGLDEILGYMCSKNGFKDNTISGGWKKCQEQLKELAEKDEVDENKIDELKAALDKLSKEMLNIGISRTERPKCSYMPEKLTLEYSELDKSEIMSFFKKKRRALKTRLALSLPRNTDPTSISGTYISLNDSNNTYPKAKSARIKKLTDDLLEGNSFLWLFVPPNMPSKPLGGVFAGYDTDRSWGKTLLFSAFSVVPAELSECIEVELDERLKNYYNDNHKGERAYKELLEDLKVPDLNGELYGENTELLKNYFKSDHAKKVLLAVYGEKLLEDYWGCVKQYCEDGCFDDVQAEFDFMPKASSKSALPEYLDNKAYTGYSACYNGKGLATDELSKLIDKFNSPFYPFVFLLTSVAEEGLDFHWYADRIVHWNAPSSPIALLQREGRIDRILCMAVRKTVAKQVKKAKNWEEAFDKMEKLSSEYDEYKALYPKFWAGPDAYRIKRYTYYYPESGEVFRWEALIKNLEFYRSMFGACDNVSLDLLSEKDKARFDKLKDLRINIKAPATQKK